MTMIAESSVEGLQTHQDGLSLHYAAQSVMRRARDGRGSFRVDGLRPDLVGQLPEYLSGFTGTYMPLIYEDDHGQIQRGGSTLVRPQDSELDVTTSWIDESTGEHRSFMKWRMPSEPTEDETVLPIEDAPEQPTKPKSHRGRVLFIGLAGLAANAVGIGMMAKGAHDEAVARQSRTPQPEAIAEARELSNQGLWVEALLPGVGMVALGGLLLADANQSVKRRESQEAETPPTEVS